MFRITSAFLFALCLLSALGCEHNTQQIASIGGGGGARASVKIGRR